MKQVCLKHYEIPKRCLLQGQDECNNCPMDEEEKEYNYLVEKYARNKSKVDVINGLIIAQALCSRSLIESYDPKILAIMGEIAKTVQEIKDSDD